MTYSFVIADVFTRTAFGGNQLAVFPDARGLSDRAMPARRGGRTVAVRVGGSTVLVGERSMTVPAGL